MSTIHVFVSYSHRDDTWVKEGTHGLIPWLAQQLKRNGVEIWYEHALKQLPGGQYKKLIKSEIDRANLAIRVRSPTLISAQYISGRNFRFKADSPGCRLPVDQLMDFPLADHDDGPDALEMCTRLPLEVSPPRETVT